MRKALFVEFVARGAEYEAQVTAMSPVNQNILSICPPAFSRLNGERSSDLNLGHIQGLVSDIVSRALGLGD